MTLSTKQVKMIGYLGSALSVAMYASYVIQIIDNLHGHKGNFVVPLAAFFNSLIWCIYGILDKPRDWPIIIANAPGVILCSTAFFTSF